MKKQHLIIILIALTLASCGESVGKINNQGNEAYARQEYDSALEAYRNAQVESPDLAEPYYNAANTYYRQEDYQQAQLQNQQALRSAEEPLAQNSFYNLGNILFNGQQFEQAVEAYKQALRLNPDDQDAKVNLELALKQIQEQQEQEEQQQQENQDQQQQNDENQDQQNEDQQEQNSEGDQEQQPQQDQQGQPTQPNQDSQSQPQGLTEGQARQLLESIAEGTETLQEKLQQIYASPGPPPAEDW